MVKKKEASQRDYANLKEFKVATYSDTLEKIWPSRVSITVLEWSFICFIYWQNFNDLNSGTWKYTLSKFKPEIMGCYPEETRQAEKRAGRSFLQFNKGSTEPGTTSLHKDMLGLTGHRQLCKKGQGDSGEQHVVCPCSGAHQAALTEALPAGWWKW